MPHFVLFRFQIVVVVFLRSDLTGNTLTDLQAVTINADQLLRIVRNEANTFDTEIQQDLGAQTILPQVRFKTELNVGFHCIQPLFLQLVRLDLVGKTDPASFLTHIDDDSGTFLCDHLHCLMELIAAIAAAGTEHIAGQTFTVDTGQHGILAGNIAHRQRQMHLIVHFRLVEMQFEIAVIRRQIDRFHALDKLFRLSAVCNDISNGAKFQTEFLFEDHQVIHTRHIAVIFRDLADHPGRSQPRQTGKVNRRFRVTGPLKDTARTGSNGEDVPGDAEVTAACSRIEKRLDRVTAVKGADPGGSGECIDTVRKSSIEVVGRRLAVDFQLPGARFRNRSTDKPAGMSDHKIDDVRRNSVRRADKVTFVFSVFIVRDNDQFSGAYIFQYALH